MTFCLLIGMCARIRRIISMEDGPLARPAGRGRPASIITRPRSLLGLDLLGGVSLGVRSL
jgi:hypothetical protein